LVLYCVLKTTDKEDGETEWKGLTKRIAGHKGNSNLVAADFSKFLSQKVEEDLDRMKVDRTRSPGIIGVWQPSA